MPHDLRPALATAVAAALEAGTLIREDFHRAAGPRGAGSHAEVDAEAERLIRQALTGGFPEWAYLGEETGASGALDGEWLWLVDPNDGTWSFLKGIRGSAVSIGLVREGVPVLGVVYAPVAPDDGGDLLTWAEGLPLTRNGRELSGRALPDRLSPAQVVLVSQDADNNPAANAACTSPARFRAVPSIAYRLALAAAGEGDGAVSLSGPTGWDLAGGHALLRGAGGDLMDERGREIRYRGGSGGGQWVFGASPAVARGLTGRKWGEVMRDARPDPLTARYALSPRVPGLAIRDPGLLARAQGCLLGLVAGDSLGGMVESMTAPVIASRYPAGLSELADGGHWNILAGQPTDDSEMALILARTLVRDGRFDEHQVREAYRDWHSSEPFDCGPTVAPALLGTFVPGSKSNGALMRAAPLGVLAHALPPGEAGELARRDAALTHVHQVCLDANAAYVVALAHAVQTGEGARPAYRAALDWATAAGAEPEVLAALRAADAGPPPRFDGWDQGLVTIALQNAFHVALHASSVQDGVARTVAQGGDTDTNAAIAGALLGALHGRDAVPLQWRRSVLSARAQEGTPRPRPACFWPVEVLELAERLLLAGA